MQGAPEKREPDRREHLRLLCSEPSIDQCCGDLLLPHSLFREFAPGEGDLRVDDALASSKDDSTGFDGRRQDTQGCLHVRLGSHGTRVVGDRSEQERQETIVVGEEHLFFVDEVPEEGSRSHPGLDGDVFDC